MNELVTKIRTSILDMMSQVRFIDGKGEHRYERKDTGEWLQGVSSVSSIVPKDWLSAWGAKECAKFLGYSDYEGDYDKAIEILEKIDSLRKDIDIVGIEVIAKRFIEFLKEAKGASGRKSKTALVDGKEGHKWLEKYVKAKIRGTELPKIPEGLLERPLKQFLEWEEKNVDYWILSEAQVAYLPEKGQLAYPGYAGTMDGLAMVKGKLAVIDFKFASHISEDYYLQTAGYQAPFEKYGIKIDQRIIIRLPKTLLKEEWDKKEFKYKMVDNNIEVEIVKTNYEFDRDIFFHCLPVKKWINQFK